jgi:hypothetical protein
MAKILQFIRKLRLPKCSICNQPVELETAKTDEDGNLVHEDCYVRRVRLKEITPPAQSFHNPNARTYKNRGFELVIGSAPEIGGGPRRSTGA